MPYRFRRTKKGVSVSKRSGGKWRKAFTAHTKSMAKAKRIARRRARYAKER